MIGNNKLDAILPNIRCSENDLVKWTKAFGARKIAQVMRRLLNAESDRLLALRQDAPDPHATEG